MIVAGAIAPTRTTIRPADGRAALGLAAVVCTHGRPEQLRRVLTSLLAQDDPPDEIVVVDSAPGEDDARTARVAHVFSGVRVVVEPRAGIGWARAGAVRDR